MGDLLEDVIQYIIDAGLATEKDVDIFKDYSPKEPDSCTIVYEYNGSVPAMFTHTSVRSVQITSRAKSAKNAKLKSWQIYTALYKEDLNITLGVHKALIALRNTPIKIDVDEKNRYLWAFNVAITINFN